MSADPAKRLASLLRRLKSEHGERPLPAPGASGAPLPPDADPLIEELVFSFLLWESTSPLAKAAHQRLRTELVDYNELRVCLANELAELVGPRDPRGDERAQRMRASLSELYRREHTITLAPLMTAGKREAKLYLESLDGIPPFVVARTLLIALGGHGVPVDERLRDLLVSEEIVEAHASVDTTTGWLERQVRSADAGPTAMLLQAWSDSQPFKRAPKVAARGDNDADPCDDRPEPRGRDRDRGTTEAKTGGRDTSSAEGKGEARATPKNADRASTARKAKAKKSGAGSG